MLARSKLPAQPIDHLQVVAHRRPLRRTRHALAGGRLNVGFLGGSITADWDQNWPSPVVAWLVEQFPEVVVAAENAAIGATGSDSGCVRADREIIARGCHLTFVEYAVNDFDKEPARRARSREGLLRKLLAAGGDVVLVHTFRQEMYADMLAGTVPASIAEFEDLARHYDIGSVWVGLHALNEVRAGRLRWDEWLPDALHPGSRGSLSYGQAVIGFLQEEFRKEDPAPPAFDPVLPPPVSPANWQSASVLPLTSVRTQGPWVLKRVHGTNHVEQVWETHTPGARLWFEFDGRGLVLIFDYGRKSSEFAYRIDGGAWVPVVRERPAWCGDRGLVRALPIAETLPPGTHRFEMEITHGDRADCTGTECRLALISVL